MTNLVAITAENARLWNAAPAVLVKALEQGDPRALHLEEAIARPRIVKCMP
jgi:hypothetical protein